MKKLLLLLIASTFSVLAYPQTQLPSKLTKGIKVEKDDFNGGIKYSSKNTTLTVISKQNECSFIWDLTCVDSAPVSFSKVLVLINGNIENIEFVETEYKEYTEALRVPRNTFSGGKMATTFVTENRYVAKATVDASKFIQLLERIVSDPKETKIRFSGSRDIDGVFDKKKKAEIKTLLTIYKALTEQKSLI